MKTKNTALIVLVFILIFSIAATQKINSKPDNIIFVNPSSIIDPDKTAGDSITVTIEIDYVEGLHAWQLFIRFNPVLLYTNRSLISEGPFLKSGGATYFPPPYIGEDYILISCLLTSKEWADGEGVLATVTFIVKGRGETGLDVYDTLLSQVDGLPILHTSQNGYFRNVAQGLAPSASFTYSPPFPLWYENVTFDASSSSDPDGISRYIWFFGDQNTANETTRVTQHPYLKTVEEPEKNFTARLAVTDSTGITGNLSITVLTVVSSRVLQDLAISGISVNPTVVEPGKSLAIKVTVLNNGTASATFNATAYYNSNIIGNQTNVTLDASYTRVLDFTWNVPMSLPLGAYQISARVWKVTNETDESNNFHVFGNVMITYPPSVSFTFSPSDPYVDELITFDASQTHAPVGNIQNYTWDFGEWIYNGGNVTTIKNPVIVHSYDAGGKYFVTLTATDNLGVTNSSSQWIEVLKLPSVISISTSPTAAVNSSSLISGSISPTQSIADAAVFYRLFGTSIWTSLANVTTDDEGQFSATWTPDESGTFEFKANWTGNQQHVGAESAVITVVAKYNSSISITLDKLLIVYGENLTISGAITPIRSNAEVTILYKLGEGSWSLLRNTVTNQSGQFAFNWTPNATGAYQLKAEWAGDSKYFGDESSVVAVNVVAVSDNGVNYFLYVGIAVVVAVAVGLILFYWKAKKGSKQ